MSQVSFPLCNMFQVVKMSECKWLTTSWTFCNFGPLASNWDFLKTLFNTTPTPSWSWVSQPYFGQVWGWSPTLGKSWDWSPPGLPKAQKTIWKTKTPWIGVFLVSLERSWNVDIENALAFSIWTSAAQVMGKRMAGSQTGSLTPDH